MSTRRNFRYRVFARIHKLTEAKIYPEDAEVPLERSEILTLYIKERIRNE